MACIRQCPHLEPKKRVRLAEIVADLMLGKLPWFPDQPTDWKVPEVVIDLTPPEAV